MKRKRARGRDRAGNWRRSLLWGLSLMIVGNLPAWAQDHQHDEPVWKWTPEQVQQQVSTVRSGESLKPKQWPNGAKVAVSISFDFDTELSWLGYAGQKSPSYLSRGEYGARTALPRILALLDKHKIPGTFFIPAGTTILHPKQVQEIVKRTQHEIGFHSYVHENPLEFKGNEERETYEKAMKIIEEKTGKRPVGFRSAGWDLTAQTIQIVKDMGFLYDSSMMADDDPYLLISEGKDSGLVELPVEWILDDWPYFQLNWPWHHVGLRTADEVFSIWSQEFDGAYAEGGTFTLVMHPQVIGHRYRIQMLERLIEYIKKKPGVWFATHEQVVRYVKEQNKQ